MDTTIQEKRATGKWYVYVKIELDLFFSRNMSH